MIHDVLYPRFPGINHKWVYRPYTRRKFVNQKAQEDQTHRGTGAAGSRSGRQPDLESIDYLVSDSVCWPGAIARRIKCLTMIDDLTYECVDIMK